MENNPRSSAHKNAMLIKLESAGLTNELAQKIINSNKLAAKVIKLIKNEDFEITISQKRAREIMKKNFFGIEEAVKYFGIILIEQQLAALSEIPATKVMLKKHENTHILTAFFRRSVLDIHNAECKLFYRPYESAWYNKHAFAKDEGKIGWHLIRKTPVENSIRKPWSEQLLLLAKDEEVPSARAIVQAIIGHYLATGEWLFKNIYVRCSDTDSNGNRIYIGGNECELNIESSEGETPCSLIGLASAKKFG